MILGYDNWQRNHLDQLVDLQTRLLPNSMFSLFGRGFTKSVYTYFSNSPWEVVFLKLENGVVCSVIVLSLDRMSLKRRIIFNTSFVLSLPIGICRPAFWKLMTTKLDNPLIKLPELILIMTNPKQQMRGHGRNLIEECEEYLKSLQFKSYCLRTGTDRNKWPVGFYENLGFSTNLKF